MRHRKGERDEDKPRKTILNRRAIIVGTWTSMRQAYTSGEGGQEGGKHLPTARPEGKLQSVQDTGRRARPGCKQLSKENYYSLWLF